MNFDIQKQIGCSCTIPAILSVNHSCLRCVNAIYCLINFISINMHRIHFPFVLLNCKICCCFSFPFRKVRNCAQQICCIPLEIASTSTRRQGKLFYKLLLLFTFCFFDVYSSTGKAMQRTQGWNSFSAPWRYSYEVLLSKGIIILPYIDLDSGEILFKREFLHILQLNVIIIVFYTSLWHLSDYSCWWKLASFWLFYCLNWSVLLIVCLSLNAVFDIDRKTQIWVSGKQVCGKEILMCVIMVKLHIVNMTVTVDYIPAVMLFPDLQEG